MEKLKEFLALLGKRTGIGSEELLEKDFLLNLLLHKLKGEEYAFKGGTCLSKVYLNYHRISEDLDFTFVEQERFHGISGKGIKRECSKLITSFGERLEEVAVKHRLDFRLDKSNRRYVEIGSNNRLATFKVWYTSALTGRESFVKVQVNYHELVLFPFQSKTVWPIEVNLSPTEKKYFEELLDFYKLAEYPVYDAREIACEKLRALLTRVSIKSRDVADLFFIEKELDIPLERAKEPAIEKTHFALRHYAKYRENFKKSGRITPRELPERVDHILLRRAERKSFATFAKRLAELLQEMRKEISD
ncbi:nucleotidyl transferase AbiEii/AbiGii toxin family protein [Candidatus Pyrohabitans sp.]